MSTKKFDIILTFNNTITGVELSDMSHVKILDSICNKEPISITHDGKRVEINPQHLILIKEN